MKPVNPLNPVEIVRLFAAKHREMRARLDELSRVAKTLLTARPPEFARALRQMRALYAELGSQIALEAKVLLPALRNADAWGKVRGDRLLEQLRRRRRELRDLRKSTANGEQKTLGPELDRFIDDRRAGMVRTERESLNPGVLRDDVLGVDVNGG